MCYLIYFLSTLVIIKAATIRGGGLALETACSKPDPVPIGLAAKKTPCPNLEINTEFN